jgi:hypothetical protein
VAVRRAFADHLAGRDLSHGRLLFTIAMLELWLEAFARVRTPQGEPVLVAA